MTTLKRMMTALTIVAAVLVVCSYNLGAYQTAAVTAAAGPDDEAMRSRIAAGLKDNSMLAPRDIDVDVKHGVVTLTGTVRDTAEKSTASRVARMAGVTSVFNVVVIDSKIDESKIDSAADKAKRGVNKAVDATVNAAKKSKEVVQKGVTKSEEGVGKAADKTADAIAKVGDKTSDAAITSRTKADLSAEPLLRDSAIEVDTMDRVVTLKGTVPSRTARGRATEIAHGVDGVTSVLNELVVRAQ